MQNRCKDSVKNGNTQENRHFFMKNSMIICNYHIFFVPLQA